MRLREVQVDDVHRPEPGDVWRDHDCWCVVLPNGGVWYSSLPAVDGSYWTVTGDSPANLTVRPSINDEDSTNPWHGWITDGEMVNA